MCFLQICTEFSLIKSVINTSAMHIPTPTFKDKVVCNKIVDKNTWSYKIKRFFSKWNQYMAAVMAVVLFVLLVGVVICDIVTSTNVTTKSTESMMSSEVFQMARINPCRLAWQCRVECANIQDGQFVDEYINELEIKCGSLSLRIESTCSINCVLPVGWLQNLSNGITLNDLNLNWSIRDIEDGAFTNYPFQSLTSLTFEDSRITNLRRNSFKGLRLNTFSFRFVGVQEVTIEEGLLADMSATLQDLQLNHCFLNEESIKNLTAADGVFLGGLQLLDLRFNTIRTIPPLAFRNANALRSLYLAWSTVATVDVQAFLGLNMLQLLHLDNNFLNTLRNGTFTYQMIHTANNIFLNNNPWNCNCELQWLKDVYLNYDMINRTVPLMCFFINGEACTANSCAFEDVIFCNETSSANESEVTTGKTEINTWNPDTPPATTTTIPNLGRGLLKIDCRDVGENPLFISETIARDYVHTQIIQIRDSCLKFDFYELEPDPLTVEIRISGDITDYHLLWFNSHQTSDTGCITNMSSKVSLEKLRRNNTYTVCLIYQKNEVVSPYDCFGFQVRVEWPYRCFIINKWIELVVSLAVILPLICCAISALIMFYCIRQNPSLIKGNKKVIIVEDATSDETILPKDHDRANYPPPSIGTYSIGRSTYMTANYHPYARVKYNYRPPILRSVSEESVLTNSYINPQAPIQSQLHTLRLNVRCRPRLDELIRTQNEYEEPPALPPLNNLRSKVFPTEENPYSSV